MSINNTLYNGTAAYACYDVFSNGIPEQLTSYLPCSEPTPQRPYVPCCGTGTYCMSDNLCYGPASNAQKTNRFYVAACTDPNFLDSSCSTHCKGQYANTIWFDNTVNEWECCNWDNLTGTNPANSKCTVPESDERWNTPLQSDVTTVGWAGSSAVASFLTASKSMPALYSITSTSTTTKRTTSASTGASSASTAGPGTASPTGSSSGTGGLTTGAKAGIGVGVGIGIPLLIAIVGFLIYRKRRSHTNQTPHAAELGGQELDTRRKYSELTGNTKVEMPAHHMGEMEAPVYHELPAQGAAAELPSR
ncbi:hypothetical protein BT63DRAFT_317159 [Microthyrium microscopicum]|uniref:Mid2 domain-containing protein n=1 Tax=Microthyrium microscopicum TaxID=703497 RepID=A0A6A6U383_9PEZI|nr:hypothetical protein BT63DRAFT_317159 [Microthyrium microscopicum]